MKLKKYIEQGLAEMEISSISPLWKMVSVRVLVSPSVEVVLKMPVQVKRGDDIWQVYHGIEGYWDEGKLALDRIEQEFIPLLDKLAEARIK